MSSNVLIDYGSFSDIETVACKLVFGRIWIAIICTYIASNISLPNLPTYQRVTQIFTKTSHHMEVSVLYLTQNIFYGEKQNRTIGLNAHYLVLFKNPRDATQVSHLARQMYPGKTNF